MGTSEIAVGYVRLSEQGKSIPAQRSLIREYCESRGFDLIEIYDDGQRSSGYSEEREQYQAMLARLEEGDVGHVVVRDRARLARDSKDRLRLLLDLDDMGVDVHVAETGEVIDLDEAYSLTRESAQADADDREKRKEAERGRREIERRQEQDLPVGAPPFGLEYSDAGDELLPSENYDVAINILERREAGESSRSIARDDGVPVSKDTVRRIEDRAELYRECAQ